MLRSCRFQVAAWVMALAICVPAGAQGPQELFDAHLHYNDEAVIVFPVADVLPFIRPYRTSADRQTWFNDPEIYALIETELARGIGYRGIGEFHVFGATDAGTAQVKKIVALAIARDLWLHAHCDEAALDALFAHDPARRIAFTNAAGLLGGAPP